MTGVFLAVRSGVKRQLWLSFFGIVPGAEDAQIGRKGGRIWRLRPLKVDSSSKIQCDFSFRFSAAVPCVKK